MPPVLLGPAAALVIAVLALAPSAQAASCVQRISIRAHAPAHGSRIVLRLERNRIAIVDRGRKLVVRARGRTLGGVRVAAKGWRRAIVTLDARAGRLWLRSGQRAVRVRVPARRSTCATRRPSTSSPLTPPAVERPPSATSTCSCDSAPTADPRPFARSSIWNAPLADDAPLDGRSDVYVDELRRQLASTNPWINTTPYSAPVYTVGAGQPTVRVTLDAADADLQRAFGNVPIPADAEPADGSDAHMVVWQPSTDTMWEFWLMARRADGWHARWGGMIDHVSQSPGYYQAPHAGWGATATSLPLLGGLIRVDELRAGRIDHALAFAIPHTRLWTTWSWPAQRSDGDIDSVDAIPEGTRFRLPPSLDIDALGLPPVTAAIAKAVQRYGMILRDKSGAISFYAEDPTPLHDNPYPGLFGTWPNVLLAKFPWDRLQALRTDLRYAG